MHVIYWSSSNCLITRLDLWYPGLVLFQLLISVLPQLPSWFCFRSTVVSISVSRITCAVTRQESSEWHRNCLSLLIPQHKEFLSLRNARNRRLVCHCEASWLAAAHVSSNMLALITTAQCIGKKTSQRNLWIADKSHLLISQIGHSSINHYRWFSTKFFGYPNMLNGAATTSR